MIFNCWDTSYRSRPAKPGFLTWINLPEPPNQLCNYEMWQTMYKLLYHALRFIRIKRITQYFWSDLGAFWCVFFFFISGYYALEWEASLPCADVEGCQGCLCSYRSMFIPPCNWRLLGLRPKGTAIINFHHFHLSKLISCRVSLLSSKASTCFLDFQIPKNGGLQSAFYAYRRTDTSEFIMGLVSLLIIINALSSFQIYAMPMFDELESIFTKRMKKPCQWWLRIILRAFFGYGVFFLAVAIPSIGSVGGLVGGISLPVTLAYPCFMWLRMKKPKKYGKMWYLNWSLGITGLILSVSFMAAGVYVIKENDSKFEWFKPK